VAVGFFQFVYNTRQRGKALLGALVAALVKWSNRHHPRTQEESPGFPQSADRLGSDTVRRDAPATKGVRLMVDMANISRDW